MKKPYSKPMVSFEDYSLDMPIAANCDMDYVDIAREFAAQGVFAESGVCTEICEFIPMDGNKLCYFTITTQLFTS